LSRHAFLIGGRTQKILQRICYSKTCGICKQNWKKAGLSKDEIANQTLKGELLPDSTHRCPRNFNGTSKSMEAQAALSLVEKIHTTGDCCVSELIIDDDSTLCSHLHHPFQLLLDHGIWTDKKKIGPKINLVITSLTTASSPSTSGKLSHSWQTQPIV